jgi:ABC-type enterochelin transport system ATPase subunit
MSLKIVSTTTRKTKKNRFSQKTINIKKDNETTIKFAELSAFAKKVVSKKKPNQNVQIIASTPLGYFTYLKYNGQMLNALSGENENYLDGLLNDDDHFDDSIYNFSVIISTLNN